MSIKISTGDIKHFEIIKGYVDKLKEEFVNKFQYAEYVYEGINNDIQLTSDNSYAEEIILPKDFTIKQTKIIPYVEYNKDLKDEKVIKEDQFYRVEINGVLEGKGYKFVYKNLRKINIEIRISTTW